MLSVEEKEENVINDSRNNGPEVQVVVGKRTMDRAREIAKKKLLNLWLHNGKL